MKHDRFKVRYSVNIPLLVHSQALHVRQLAWHPFTKQKGASTNKCMSPIAVDPKELLRQI